MVWETESAAVPQSFALIAGCSRLGDGFVLLAEGPEGEAYGLLFFDRDGKNMEIRSIHARGYAIAMACKQDTIHILLQAPADAGGAFFVLAVRRTGGQDAKKTVTTSADIVLSDLFAVGQNYLLPVPGTSETNRRKPRLSCNASKRRKPTFRISQR